MFPRPVPARVARAVDWVSRLIFRRAAQHQKRENVAPTLYDSASLRLARHLAHELNNVLAVVLAGTDIIEDAKTAMPSARSAAAAISSAAQEGLDLTARMTSLIRQHDLAPMPCDVVFALNAFRPRLARAAGGPERLRLEVPIAVLPALIDQDQFRASLVELVVAARWFNPDDVIVMRIREAVPRRNGSLPIRSAPNEIAIDVEVPRRAAGRAVERRPGQHTDDPDGPLAIVSSFASGSGGRLDRHLSDTLSRITLHLPRLPQVALAHQSQPRDHSRMQPARLKAIVVEDNDLLRAVLSRGLRERGFDVGEARDAAEAEAQLLPDVALLVTDIVLPGDIDGFGLARSARARDPRLALLFVSAFMSARLPEVLATDDLASFVRKPIDFEELVAVLDGLLAVRGDRARHA